MCRCPTPPTWRRWCCHLRIGSRTRCGGFSDASAQRAARPQRRHADLRMPEVLMPKLSDTMEEGKIIRWLKQRGDRVAIGDILAEVETDKANMELEAYDEGVLAEIRTPEGESAPVGAVIAVLGEGAADGAPGGEPASPPETPRPAERPAAAARPAPATEAAAAEPREDASGGDEHAAPSASQASAPPVRPAPAREPKPPKAEPLAAREEATEERVRASPLARRVARDRGVDLSTLTGSGPGGRIVERDVEQVAAKKPASPEPATRPRAVAAAPRPAAAEAPAARVELGKIRRATAKRMTEAKRDVPHFYASADIAMDECVRLKDGLAALGGEYAGITYTHLVLKAVGAALRRVREMNASFDGDTIVLHDTVHIALATATDDGLVVPVVRDCDRQPLAALVVQARAL